MAKTKVVWMVVMQDSIEAAFDPHHYMTMCWRKIATMLGDPDHFDATIHQWDGTPNPPFPEEALGHMEDGRTLMRPGDYVLIGAARVVGFGEPTSERIEA